jgi:LDH2 family malate/lactate/ureidoglycolate dehydrogenase
MNVPPKEAIRVPAEALRTLVAALLERVGVGEADRTLLAELLVRNDLHGVFSHGSRQVATYARDIRDGKLNPRPSPDVVNESPALLHLDGDGGLGYFASYPLAQALVEKARAIGVAVGVTRNHGHFGAAGIYSRIAVSASFFGYVTSGHQLQLEPGQSILTAAGGSPHSFGVPAGHASPLVLDFGAIHDVGTRDPHALEIFAMAPALVFRHLGLGAVCQSIGGFLGGVPARSERANRRWSGANQGSFMVFVDVSRFLRLEEFQREMDDYIAQTATLQPLPGYDQSLLPGAIEAQRGQAYAVEGVPVGSAHRDVLTAVAAEIGVPTPW